MKDRTNEEEIDPVTDGPTDDARRRGESGNRDGGKHGAPQERTMIEEILEPENLAEAWKRVRANKGAPGIDGMTVEDFPAFARGHWPRIAAAIREGTYWPAPVKRVWIPKPDGSKRPLGIPTVLDRVIRQAVAQKLGPLFEVDFSEHSHGYRPGRSAHKAVAVLEESWKEGRRHAVECDLESFFDTVNHDRLMNALKEKVRCRKTPGPIRRYLTAGDHQLQPSFAVTDQRRHHPLRRVRAFHRNDEVVGISRELVSARLQLLVERIGRDVG